MSKNNKTHKKATLTKLNWNTGTTQWTCIITTNLTLEEDQEVEQEEKDEKVSVSIPGSSTLSALLEQPPAHGLHAHGLLIDNPWRHQPFSPSHSWNSFPAPPGPAQIWCFVLPVWQCHIGHLENPQQSSTEPLQTTTDNIGTGTMNHRATTKILPEQRAFAD